MIPKSGNRFSEKDHAQTKELERDDDSKKNHPALARRWNALCPSSPPFSATMRAAVSRNRRYQRDRARGIGLRPPDTRGRRKRGGGCPQLQNPTARNCCGFAHCLAMVTKQLTIRHVGTNSKPGDYCGGRRGLSGARCRLASPRHLSVAGIKPFDPNSCVRRVRPG